MGCAASTHEEGEDPLFIAKETDKAISRAINGHEGVNSSKNILLLGAGESGKSTVLKQLKILHKDGFTSMERRHFAQVIWDETVDSMVTLLIEARKRKIELKSDLPESGLKSSKDLLLNYEQMSRSGKEFDVNDRTSLLVSRSPNELASSKISRSDIASAIDELWTKENNVRALFEKRNEFQLSANADYYFKNIYRFADTSYMATDEDILKARIKTTGITETKFVIHNENFKIFDAGGQRSERKKWLKYFNNISAVLFVFAISEYDEVLFEDNKVNRMREALNLFKTLITSRYFDSIPFILFLNKTDLLEIKIARSPIQNYLENFSGNSRDLDDIYKHFYSLFKSFNVLKRPLYIHKTCATDSKSMKFVLTAVTDIFVQDNLKAAGML